MQKNGKTFQGGQCHKRGEGGESDGPNTDGTSSKDDSQIDSPPPVDDETTTTNPDTASPLSLLISCALTLATTRFFIL